MQDKEAPGRYDTVAPSSNKKPMDYQPIVYWL